MSQRSFTSWAAALLALALSSAIASAADIIPADRRTTWNPGLNPVGGIPSRTTIYQTINASAYGNGASDATAGIQAALDACPVNQVVLLSAGTFKVTKELSITKGIVLRGAGPTQTKIMLSPALANHTIIVVGTAGFKPGQSVNLATDAVRGATSVTLASNPGLVVGELVELDELTDPSLAKWGIQAPPGDPSRGWFNRMERPIGQVLEIASISGTTIAFTTPLHSDFKKTFTAQLSRFMQSDGSTLAPAVKYAGVEDLYVNGGGWGQGNMRGNIHLENCAYSWIRNIESDHQDGEGIGIDACFRCTVRDSYVHSTATPSPGGGGYGISYSWYASDNLLENCISWNMNKVMVMRAGGGGNVIGYNYFEDGWIDYAPGWVESGANASHMTCSHYELFEGNQAFNFGAEDTWGNAIDITCFRNHFTGRRRSVSPLSYTDQGNRCAVYVCEGHWWYNFVGNVLGFAGQTNPGGFTYASNKPWPEDPWPMWKLGWDPDDDTIQDPKVLSTILRHGNWDYATSSIVWDPTISEHTMPSSLYLSGKPAFFGSNTWPWVQPEGTTKTYTLPARARFDAIHGIGGTTTSGTTTSGTTTSGTTTSGTTTSGTTTSATTTTSGTSTSGGSSGGSPVSGGGGHSSSGCGFGTGAAALILGFAIAGLRRRR